MKYFLNYLMATAIWLLAARPALAQVPLAPATAAPAAAISAATPITLAAVLQAAGASNLTVREYELRAAQALADQAKAQEWWLPTLTAGGSTHYLHGAAMNTDGRIFSGISQNYLWAGLGLSADVDFGKGPYLLAAARARATAAAYTSAAERNQLLLRAVQTYYDLQTEQLKADFLLALAGQADTLARQLQIQVGAGLRYQSEYLLAQGNARHLRLSLLQAQVAWRKQSAQLVSLLNLPPGTRLVSADAALAPLPPSAAPPTTVSHSAEQRPEFGAFSAQLQATGWQRKAFSQGLRLPRLRLGVDNWAFGSYGAPVYNTVQINASLLWTLPLGRLSYNGDLRQLDTRLAVEQTQLRAFENRYALEAATAEAQLVSSTEQLATAREALQLTQETLRQSLARQQLGTAKPFEVFQVQQFYLQARLDYLQVISDYNKAQYALKVAQGEAL